MVVPIERVSTSHKAKKYVGNDLNLSICANKRLLIVTGNNCKIKLSENSGLIKVVGDYGDITVLNGSGYIEYIGNYGKIKLGLDMTEDIVTYIGNGGEISTNCSTSATMSKQKTCPSHRGSRNSKNYIEISNVTKINYATSILPNIIQIPNSSVRINKHLKEKTHA